MTNPAYFVASVLLLPRFHASDALWAQLIGVGFLLGVISLVCGLPGKGPRRLTLILISCGETFLWWFTAVGL